MEWKPIETAPKEAQYAYLDYLEREAVDVGETHDTSGTIPFSEDTGGMIAEIREGVTRPISGNR
jgi:hypothetical protein